MIIDRDLDCAAVRGLGSRRMRGGKGAALHWSASCDRHRDLNSPPSGRAARQHGILANGENFRAAAWRGLRCAFWGALGQHKSGRLTGEPVAPATMSLSCLPAYLPSFFPPLVPTPTLPMSTSSHDQSVFQRQTSQAIVNHFPAEPVQSLHSIRHKSCSG
jgi:hypothetical protein